MLRASRAGAERARSPVAPPPHLRAPAPAPAPRYSGSALLVGLALLGLGLYCYGTVLHSQPHTASKTQLLLPWHVLTKSFSSHQRHLRRTAAPLSVCDSTAISSSPVAGMKEQYSIWAMPKGPMGDRLRSEIAHLAQRHGGPAFPPHVTVLGDIERPREEVMAMMKELAAQVKKHRINFVEVTRGTFFYQCVFLLVAKDEGTMAAAAAARNVFGMTTPPYMPHLSLLYADLADEEKAKVVEQETARLYGESSGYDTLLVETGYEVGSLALWYTPTEDTSTQSWCLVEEYPLS